MWTRSAKQENGTFSITVYNQDGSVYLQQDGFTSTVEADKAAELAQRNVLFGEPELPEMSDDEILAELGL